MLGREEGPIDKKKSNAFATEAFMYLVLLKMLERCISDYNCRQLMLQRTMKYLAISK